jgi:hypothetical protein
MSSSSSTKDAFNNSSPNLVTDWLLFVAGGSDEELILNVNEVLAVLDDIDVRICNRVLFQLAYSQYI